MLQLRFIALIAALLWACGPVTAQELSIDVTEAEGEDFDQAIDAAVLAGATVTSLSLFWDDLEAAGGEYAPKDDWPTIANGYYPDKDLALTLSLSVIDTLADRRPEDLRGLAWDDPVVIRRFAKHLEQVFRRLEDVEIRAISIGNEVDGYLRKPADIRAFATFMNKARAQINRFRAGVPVGTKLTFGALKREPYSWSPLISQSDAVMVTYYPLKADFSVQSNDQVRQDLRQMLNFAARRPLYILEAGYPSEGCGAGQDGQLEFVQTLLDEAGQEKARIPLISLTWLSDIPDAQVEDYVSYYGVEFACFRSYLASLGLRDRTGLPKLAYEWLANR